MRAVYVTRFLVVSLAAVALPGGCGKSGVGTASDAAARLDVPGSTGGVAGGGGAATGGAGGAASRGVGGAGGALRGGAGGGSSAGAGGSEIPDASSVGDAPSRTGGAGGAPITLGAGGGATTTVRGGSSGAGGLSGTGGGATSTGGASRSGGAGGTTANAGGFGGGGTSGGGGATTTLDGGVAACHVIDGLDRSCTADADCIAVEHTSNCCGQLRYIGLRTTGSATFAANEPACRASYPRCGCGVMPPTMDDGSMDNRQPAKVGVTCLAGTCTTFMLDCGKPCASGTTCFSCSSNSQPYAVCTTQCLNPSSSSTECPNPAFPVCQRGSAGSLVSTFCTAAGVVCSNN